MGHQKTLRDHASELAETLTPHVEAARTKAAPMLADARDKAAPVIADAREKAAPVIADVRAKATPVLVDARAKAAPVIADARAKAAPVLADARDKAAPYVSDARNRLATEVLPAVTAALATLDAATEEARHETVKRSKAVAAALKGEVEAPQPKKRRGRLALLLLAVGGAIFAVSRKLSSRKPTTNWQSSYTPPPATSTDPSAGSTGPTTGVGAEAVEGGLHRADDTANDTAAAEPGEAVSDATEVPHTPTTPDNPVVDIDVDRQ
jgi:F0F1-type ATP synthase membrane subunit b/b'